MSFAEKNQENLDALVFALSEREKTTILIGIYDTDTTREQAIAHINRQLKAQRTLTLDLFGQKIDSLLAFFRENLPPPKGEKLPIAHITRLDPLLFTARNHKVVSSDLVAQINMEREMLFHETQALVVIWLSRDGYNRLRMDAPDFMDWVAASFVFEKTDSETAAQMLSFTLPRETTEDRSKAALLELREKADKLQQRTLKFEQRAQLSTKDAKEYFNLLLALIAVLKDLHDLEQVETAINRAYNLAKTHQLAAEFEMGKLLLDWGDTETALGELHKAMLLFEEALQYFTMLDDTGIMAVAYSRLGDTHSALGDLKQALTYFEDYNRLEKELHEAFPENVGFKSGLAISYERLGITHSALGDLQQALGYFEEYNRLEKELHDAFPQNVGFKSGLAISYSRLGDTHSALGDLQRALGYFEKDLELSKELHEAFPQNVEYKNGLAISYQYLGNTHSDLGDMQQALTYFEQYNQLTKELHDAFPQNVDFKSGFGWANQFLGITHSSLGNLDDALIYFKHMSHLFKDIYEVFPQNAGFKNGLAISYQYLGVTHSALGDLHQALTHFEQFNRLEKELYEAFPQNVEFKDGLAISYQYLGATHSALGDLQQALTYFEGCNRLEKELYEAFPQNVEYKSNYAESLAMLFAIKKLLLPAQEVAPIDVAIQLFEELYSSSPRDHYQKKSDLCIQMKSAVGEDLKRLVSEMSSF